MGKLQTSGDRVSWLNAVANQVMDGGTNPPSIERLDQLISSHIVTGINDGHVTAAIVFGEAKRGDYRAGQRFIIGEMVQVLREQGFVDGDDQALRWLKPLDGTWQVALEDRQITVRGQIERRLSRERNILGERTDSNQTDGMLLLGKHHPFEVEIIGPRGASTKRELQVHSLALAIPPMTQAERETMRDSIARDGVKMPLVLYQGKVLDGRHRLYFASILNKPVHINEFTGSEAEARRYVAILNLHRRHLSSAQQHGAAIGLFGEMARQQAEQAIDKGRDHSHEARRLAPLKTAEPKTPDRDGEWHNIVAREANAAGLNVTPSGIRAMKQVMDAPVTLAKVESGEIKFVKHAHDAALIEKQMPAPTSFEGVSIVSINRRLGQCIEHLNAILKDCDMPIGLITHKISERLNEIEALVPTVRQALRDRRVIE